MFKICRNNVCTLGDPYSWPDCCSVRFFGHNHQIPPTSPPSETRHRLPHLRYAPLPVPLPQVKRVELPNTEASPHPDRPPLHCQ